MGQHSLVLIQDMKKFCLSWNSFLDNSTKSLIELRNTQNFVDVTLVGDDGLHIMAHKVVLSSSSDFFKENLLKVDHPHPMIFLAGFDSKVINSIMDYIYNGQVQLFQNEIDLFLDSAQKLKIEGLIESNDDNKLNFKNKSSSINQALDVNDENGEKHYQEQNYSPVPSKSATVALHDDDAKKAVEDLIIKSDNGWACNACGKFGREKGNIRKHVEIHVDGLSFSCNVCFNTFRSRMMLNNHKRSHK